MTFTKRRSRLFLLLFLVTQFLAVTVFAAECSKTKLCATGCCSSAGFCGTTKDHCGKGCLSTCDFKTECDKNNPCKGNACCSKFGHCGLGPDFCGKDCVAGCDAKGECDPGGFGSKFANHTKCPLNVCCSKHGYCGTTKDFCGKKTVNRPSCSAKGPMHRVVGYIEGWASTRSCDRYSPSDIPDGVYTHINFAFASIDPKTFQIIPASSKDPQLYRELARKKKIDPNLKIFIAIGGWAFNDPGPTITTFSDIARSDANTRTFIKSLISFISTYDFDGVDIDWEYPAADDREGREEDFDNLPKFLSKIKSALKQSGGRSGLSIAIPASYWYLQHFDLEKISKYVDHFNVMTYDLHGAWDTPKSWLGNHLNSHTNLTEIKDAFDLLWRNNIDPDQVNMGLAFYARTFTASSTGCMSTGCLFDAGGPAEPCTNAVGVMSNPEIMRKLGGKIGSGDLDKTAAIKTVKIGSTWLTYDDVDTWKLKLDFARSQCLGGAMVWAISQDTSDGKFSKQLQVATGYKSKGISKFNSTTSFGGGVFIETSESEANTDISGDQCKWTNCRRKGKGCPGNWIAVENQSSEKLADLMTDDTGCDDDEERTFCCPAGVTHPTCEWQFYNNGHCIPGCGSTSGFEVASSKRSCSSGYAQTACCKGNTKGLDVYRQYKWYELEADCARDEGHTPCGWDVHYDSLLVESWDGSGDQTCYDRKGQRGERPLCENTRDEDNPHFSNCYWSDDYNLGVTETVTTGTCRSSCPDGKVKVALNSKNNKCGKGTSAYCCDVTASYDDKDIDWDNLEDLIKEWVENPTCPNVKFSDLEKGKLSSRSLDAMALDPDEQLFELTKRDSLHKMSAGMTMVLVVQQVMQAQKNSRATREYRELLDKNLPKKWKHLVTTTFAGSWLFLQNAASTLEEAWIWVCSVDEEEKWEERKLKTNLGKPNSTSCSIPSLDYYDPSSLEDPRDKPGDDGIEKFFGPANRPIGPLGPNGKFIWPLNEMLWPSEWANKGLDKRGSGKRRPFNPMCNDAAKTTWLMHSEPYPSGDNGDFFEKKTGDNKRYWVDNIGGDCYNAMVRHEGTPPPNPLPAEWISEHLIELQTVSNFMEYTMGVPHPKYGKKSPSKLNRKPPYNSNTQSHVACGVWVNDFQYGFLAWNNKYKDTPQTSFFKLLGSSSNAKHMVNCEKKLNNLKGSLWDFNEPVGKDKWRDDYSAMDDDTVRHALEQLMLVEQIFPYLRKDDINTKLKSANNEVIALLDEFDALYQMQYNANPLGLSTMWRNYMFQLLTNLQEFAKEWLKLRIEELKSNIEAEVVRRMAVVVAQVGLNGHGAAVISQNTMIEFWNSVVNHQNGYAGNVDQFQPQIFKD
ncbi:hypothetical protein BFJ68_g16130 [Fusarium oxysporum]|uniref:chitinase n=1 Tax=Fusarium oxysporum TaxID=5507 RepID=A0A420PGR1_FUSOX|nr:hypothetical protein BFJ68_g16130 [Fusarium oxysporum]